MDVTVNNMSTSISNRMRIVVSEFSSGPWSSSIKFVESIDPPYDPHQDDYKVTYEASFEPDDLERAYLKIFVTEAGSVGIGLETRYRISKRLGVRLPFGKEAFAAGQELLSINPIELKEFISLVSRGNIAVRASLSMIGLGRCCAVIARDDLANLNVEGTSGWSWLKTYKINPDTPTRKLIRYKPWGSMPLTTIRA